MSATSEAILLGVFTLASCIWVGGYVATRTLEPGQRVAFFRGLGRSYLLVGGPALVLALGAGAGLLSDHAWTACLPRPLWPRRRWLPRWRSVSPRPAE